jgi:predicted DNA-binding transcriptional regulator AlpA
MTHAMPSAETVEIDGQRYVRAAEVVRLVRVSRQTLWRWRQAGHIPVGFRLRDGHVVFTLDELEAIRRYASKVQPATVGESTSKGARTRQQGT